MRWRYCLLRKITYFGQSLGLWIERAGSKAMAVGLLTGALEVKFTALEKQLPAKGQSSKADSGDPPTAASVPRSFC